MYYDQFNTRIGAIVVAGNDQGLTHLYIDNGSKPSIIEPHWQHKPERFIDAQHQIRQFLIGERHSFNLKLAPQGTEFQKQVWQALTDIPYAQTASYKTIAEKVGNGNASRAVGMANNKNPIPIIIPCHRVIGSNKKLTGYAFGLEVKAKLLELELINSTFDQLISHYGRFSWWPAENAYEVMVGSILTQNTNWANVEKALANFAGHLSPSQIENMPLDRLAELIRPSGYYNQKAKKLKALTAWFKQYYYDIDQLKKQNKHRIRTELLAISGIGPETADSILVYTLDKASFVIDAYTRRIFSRIGLNVPKDYDDFRLLIESAVTNNADTYAYFHGLIVEHAKSFCSKSKPKCGQCPIRERCHFAVSECTTRVFPPPP